MDPVLDVCVREPIMEPGLVVTWQCAWGNDDRLRPLEGATPLQLLQQQLLLLLTTTTTIITTTTTTRYYTEKKHTYI
jgi:hypothetical protein